MDGVQSGSGINSGSGSNNDRNHPPAADNKPPVLPSFSSTLPADGASQVASQPLRFASAVLHRDDAKAPPDAPSGSRYLGCSIINPRSGNNDNPSYFRAVEVAVASNSDEQLKGQLGELRRTPMTSFAMDNVLYAAAPEERDLVDELSTYDLNYKSDIAQLGCVPQMVLQWLKAVKTGDGEAAQKLDAQASREAAQLAPSGRRLACELRVMAAVESLVAPAHVVLLRSEWRAARIAELRHCDAALDSEQRAELEQLLRSAAAQDHKQSDVPPQPRAREPAPVDAADAANNDAIDDK